MRSTLSVRTQSTEQFVDVTASVEQVVRESGILEGTATCFVAHTTAGITINENADPSVVRDILFALDRAVPDKGFTHAEGNSAAHVKSSMMGASLIVLVEGGLMKLGTWQGIYFCEFDGPRNRKLLVSVDGQ
jgi:secondary thiamine-phosphate synthase enzyme